MSSLGDLLVEHGPFTSGEERPRELKERLNRPTAADFNALRDELIELRAAATDRDRANELSDQIATELRLVTRERDSLARRCAARFEETQALKAQLAASAPSTGPAQPLPAGAGPDGSLP